MRFLLVLFGMALAGLGAASCSSDTNPVPGGPRGSGGSGGGAGGSSNAGSSGSAGGASREAGSAGEGADATTADSATVDVEGDGETDTRPAGDAARDAPIADAPIGPIIDSGDGGAGRVPQQGLVLYLRLDDNPPTSALDEVTGTKGMAQNCTSAAGKVGAAFDFAGRNVNPMMQSSLIQFPDRPALNPTTAITVGAWIRPRTGDQGGGPRILQKGYDMSDQDTQYRFILNGTSIALLLFNQGNTTAISAPMPPLNEWHHVAATWDNASGVGIVYVDGAAKRQTMYKGAIGTSPMPLFIGTKHDRDTVTNWDGALDEIVLYNRALTAPEVQQLASSL